MLLSLRSQWRDRAYRKSIYQSPRSLASKTMNFSEYDRSASRSEVPSHYKKIDVPKVNAEAVAIKRHGESFRDPSMSSPLASPKQIPSLTRNASQKSQRPFYYLEDNEIISVDSFAGVYKDMKVFQKIQLKNNNKKDIEEKKKKIDAIKRSNSKQALCKSLSISTVDFCHPLRTVSDSSPAVRIDNQAESMEADSTSQQIPVLSPIASQFKSHSMVASNVEDKNKISSYFKKPGRRYIKGLTSELTEESPKTTISDQKLTEKEVNKHFISMTVSPRFMRNVTSARKEKNYSMMFKDPKTMDSAVENSIRSAHKKLINKIATSESHRYPSQAREATSPVSSLDEIDKIDKMARIKERDMLFQTESFAVSTREDDLKLGESIGKKIQDTIKHIDSVLRTSSINLTGARSPKKPIKPKVEGVRVKNKFPLRSAVAQKYGLNDKVNDQKRMALKIREVTSAYKKELKGSSMNDQRYQSFYHN